MTNFFSRVLESFEMVNVGCPMSDVAMDIGSWSDDQLLNRFHSGLADQFDNAYSDIGHRTADIYHFKRPQYRSAGVIDLPVVFGKNTALDFQYPDNFSVPKSKDLED